MYTGAPGKNSVVKTMDSRLDLTRGSKMVLQEGARTISVQSRNANTATAQGVSFDNIDPGNPSMCVDRKIYVKAGFNIRVIPRRSVDAGVGGIEAADANTLATNLNTFMENALGLGKSFAPRAFPLARACRTVELIVNNETFSYPMNNFIDAVMRYDNMKLHIKPDYSMTASFQDVTDTQSPGGTTSYGNLQPNEQYKFDYSRARRGTFVREYPQVINGNIIFSGAGNRLVNNFVITNAISEISLGFNFVNGGRDNIVGLDSIDIKFFVTEPIMLPVLIFGKLDSRGFIGVNDLKLTLAYDTDIADKVMENDGFGPLLPTRIGSAGLINIGAVAGAVQTLNITVTTATWPSPSEHQIFLNILTPKITPELPDSNIYEDARVRLVTKELAADLKYNSGNLSSGTIPKRIYVWAEQRTKNVGSKDLFLGVSGMTFSWNNQNVQFASSSPEQLYMMCKRNGLIMDYPAFKLYTGAVLCIDFAHDVGLDSASYLGQIGNFNFTMTIDFANTVNTAAFDPANQVYDVKTLIIEEGFCIIQNQQCTRVGGLIQVDINSVPLVIRDYSDKWADIYGGGFVDDMKAIGKRGAQIAHSAITKGKDIYQKVEPYAKKGFDLAKKYGPSIGEAVAMLAAGGMSESEAKRLIDTYGLEGVTDMYGSGIKAGKKVSKKSMKKKLDTPFY